MGSVFSTSLAVNQQQYLEMNEAMSYTLVIGEGSPKLFSIVKSVDCCSATSRGVKGISEADAYIAISVPFSRSRWVSGSLAPVSRVFIPPRLT